MNRLITEGAIAALEGAGLTVALGEELPPNDGAIIRSSSRGGGTRQPAARRHRPASPFQKGHAMCFMSNSHKDYGIH